MTILPSWFRYFFKCALVVGISLAGIPITQADGPDGPVRPLDPALVDKMHKDLENAEREYLARTKPARQTGILNKDEVGPAFPKNYSYENGWAGFVNNEYVIVRAGATSYDPRDDSVKFDPLTVHGFVIITKGDGGKPNFRSRLIYTPTAVGSLRITAANGIVLTVRSRQGKEFHLNVETEQLTPVVSR